MTKAALVLAGLGFAAGHLIAVIGIGPANAQSQDNSDRCISAADNFVRLGTLQPIARNAFVSTFTGMENRAVAKLNERTIPIFVLEKCEKETIHIGGLYSDYANCQDEMLNKLDESQLRRASYWELIRDGRLERLYWRISDCREAARPKFHIPGEPRQAPGVCVTK